MVEPGVLSQAKLMGCEDGGHMGAFLHVTDKTWSSLVAKGSVLLQKGPLVRVTP